MQLHELKRKTSRKFPKRVGRGGKRGKTSGRGTKGQKARAGHRIRPDVREKLKKLPKLRGYRFKSIAEKPQPVNVSVLETLFADGDRVDPAALAARNVVRLPRGKSVNMVRVKILGDGELSKKLFISRCSVSAAARQKIEKAGGTIAS